MKRTTQGVKMRLLVYSDLFHGDPPKKLPGRPILPGWSGHPTIGTPSLDRAEKYSSRNPQFSLPAWNDHRQQSINLTYDFPDRLAIDRPSGTLTTIARLRHVGRMVTQPPLKIIEMTARDRRVLLGSSRYLLLVGSTPERDPDRLHTHADELIDQP